MKKLVFGLLCAATVGVAVPAIADPVVHARPDGTVMVTHERPIRHHRLHREVVIDRHGHRHFVWR